MVPARDQTKREPWPQHSPSRPTTMSMKPCSSSDELLRPCMVPIASRPASESDTSRRLSSPSDSSPGSGLSSLSLPLEVLLRLSALRCRPMPRITFAAADVGVSHLAFASVKPAAAALPLFGFTSFACTCSPARISLNCQSDTKKAKICLLRVREGWTAQEVYIPCISRTFRGRLESLLRPDSCAGSAVPDEQDLKSEQPCQRALRLTSLICINAAAGRMALAAVLILYGK